MAFWGWPKVASHWNWEDQEDPINVRCYTNCDQVELFLNDKSLGEKSVSGDKTDYRLRKTSGPDMPRLIIDKPLWEIKFAAGTIKAVGKKNGKVAAIHELVTADKPAKIKLTPDRNVINADGFDVCHVVVEVLDEKGNLVPYADNEITYNVTGNGKIIGIGNGNQQSLESTQSKQHSVYQGKGLVIFQSLPQSG